MWREKEHGIFPLEAYIQSNTHMPDANMNFAKAVRTDRCWLQGSAVNIQHI